MATSNNTQGFLPAEGEWEMRTFPFKASVAITDGKVVAPEIASNDVTGYLTTMGTENATGADFVGILAEPIAATDADYATAGKLKNVWVPKTRYARAKFTVGAGTFTAADVFRTVEIHSDAASLAVDTKGKGARIVKFINSTSGECVFDLPATETA